MLLGSGIGLTTRLAVADEINGSKLLNGESKCELLPAIDGSSAAVMVMPPTPVGETPVTE